MSAKQTFQATVDEDGTISVRLPRTMAGAAIEITATAVDPSEAGELAPERETVEPPSQNELFLNLLRMAPLDEGVPRAHQAIVEAAARVVRVGRASVWLYDKRKTKLECSDLYELPSRTHTSGIELSVDDFPGYFDALDAEELIVAHDAHSDMRTAEFSASYLTPLGIGSMLDAPIRLRGQTVGVLCLEHIGPPRRWSQEDQAEAAYLGHLCSIALEMGERRRAEASLEASSSLLSATLESTADGILAVDRNQKIVGLNTRFIEMWNMPDAVLTSQVRGERLQFLAAQTTDPEGYVRRARELSNDPESEGVDVLELLDGRVFERHSKPQWLGTQPVGRVWSYRDITAQRNAERDLRREREKANNLLRNMLPAAIAARLMQSPSAIADRFESVTVLFADIVGFTTLATMLSPEALVGLLNEIFSAFDELAETHGVEKIKTIGDSYMAAAGVPTPRLDHALAAAKLALGMRDAVDQISVERGLPIHLRIGLCTGPVVAGVIGINRLVYDLWGETVNTASRMESHGLSGEIQVSESTRRELDGVFAFEDRGMLEMKGIGEMRTFLLEPLREDRGREAMLP